MCAGEVPFGNSFGRLNSALMLLHLCIGGLNDGKNTVLGHLARLQQVGYKAFPSILCIESHHIQYLTLDQSSNQSESLTEDLHHHNIILHRTRVSPFSSPLSLISPDFVHLHRSYHQYQRKQLCLQKTHLSCPAPDHTSRSA